MNIFGLSGGIASGKSLAARYFGECGALVLDADQLGRELLAPGTPLTREVLARFGPTVGSAAGEIDRRALRRLIFTAAEKRCELEGLLHPAIWEAARRRFENNPSGAPLGIFEAALLVESGLYRQLDGLIVVDCAEETQRRRLARRDGVSPDEIEQTLKSQTSRAERLKLAHYVLNNDGDPDALRAAVVALFAKLCALSRR